MDAVDRMLTSTRALDDAVHLTASRLDSPAGSSQDYNFKNFYYDGSEGVREDVAMNSIYGANINEAFTEAVGCISIIHERSSARCTLHTSLSSYRSDRIHTPSSLACQMTLKNALTTRQNFQGWDNAPVDGDRGFDAITYYAKDALLDSEDQPESVLEIAGNPDSGIIISTYSYATNDLNEPAKRAYSSTLTWNAWVAIAGSFFHFLTLATR